MMSLPGMTPEEAQIIEQLLTFDGPHYRFDKLAIIHTTEGWVIQGEVEYACGCVKRFGVRGEIADRLLEEIHRECNKYVKTHGIDEILPQPTETRH